MRKAWVINSGQSGLWSCVHGDPKGLPQTRKLLVSLTGKALNESLNWLKMRQAFLVFFFCCCFCKQITAVYTVQE